MLYVIGFITTTIYSRITNRSQLDSKADFTKIFFLLRRICWLWSLGCTGESDAIVYWLVFV